MYRYVNEENVSALQEVENEFGVGKQDIQGNTYLSLL